MVRTERTRRTPRPATRLRRALAMAAGLGLTLALTAAPAVAAQSDAPPSVRTAAADGVDVQAVTLTYEDHQAPSFQAEIARSTEIWNAVLANVMLVEVEENGDFEYIEGSFPPGSHTDTDGQGHGAIYLDLAHGQVYDVLRIITHETGHILGLPDNYEGPCSELMSGGGPGPSCTNPYPNAAESARVDLLWASGSPSARHRATAAAH